MIQQDLDLDPEPAWLLEELAGPWVDVTFARADREPGDARGASWSARLSAAGVEREAARMATAYTERLGVSVVARIGGAP